MFEYSLVSGLTASGADAYLLHVTTTPSVAYVARTDDFDCGIMISASHNPYYDNGIKLINSNGEKIDEETIFLVEDYIDGKLRLFGQEWKELPYAHKDAIGCTVDYVADRNRYMEYLISLGVYSFKGMKVGLGCANGSSWNMAKSIFEALGAKGYVINNEPNGLNINNNAGEKEKDITVSIIRVLSMVMIILEHLLLWKGISTKQLLSVGVEIFLFISGYLYGDRVLDSFSKFMGEACDKTFAIVMDNGVSCWYSNSVL